MKDKQRVYTHMCDIHFRHRNYATDEKKMHFFIIFFFFWYRIFHFNCWAAVEELCEVILFLFERCFLHSKVKKKRISDATHHMSE